MRPSTPRFPTLPPWSLVLGSLLSALTGGCALASGAEAEQETTHEVASENVATVSQRMRVLTLNTYLRSPLVNGGALSDDPDLIPRANKIADLILGDADGYDVVAFNEVWDDDAKGVLRDRLKAAFPHYVYQLSTTGDVAEDSGLMLFSRHPFLSIPTNGGSTSGVQKSMSPQYDAASSNTYVVYTRFAACANTLEDCMSSKGVGLVRISHPTKRIYNVAFTHLQADGEPEHQTARAKQLGEIERTLTASLGAARLRNPSEVTLLMGDFNIEGDAKKLCDPTALGSTCSLANPPSTTAWTSSEYAREVWDWDAGKLPLYDVQRMMSPKDRALTHINRHRYDYILLDGAGYSRGGETYWQPWTTFTDWSQGFICPQWARRVLETTTSDHFGYALELGPGADRCTPKLAGLPELDPTWASKKQVKVKSTIAAPGAVQWYRFTEPGTYQFGFTNYKSVVDKKYLALDVFYEDDLSKRLNVYRDEPPKHETLTDCDAVEAKAGLCATETSTYYVDRPVYVRVYDPKGLYNGEYAMSVKKRDCASKEWACVLKPGAAPFDPKPPAGANYTGWFMIDTDKATRGGAQDMSISLTKAGVSAYTMSIVDENGTPVPGYTPIVDNTASTQTHSRHDTGGHRYYVNVKRFDNNGSYKVRWKTNLTWLFGTLPKGAAHYPKGISYPGATPMVLYCTDETGSDWGGSDELMSVYSVDGEVYTSDKWDEIDTGDVIDLAGYGPVSYVNSVRLQMYELDDGSGHESGFVELPTLSPDVPDNVAQWPTFLIADGDYEFHFSQSHSLY